LKINNQCANFQQKLSFCEMMRNLSFLLFLFLAATLILSSSSKKTDHNCEKELRHLRVVNDSLVQRLAEAQTHAEELSVLVTQEQKVAEIARMEADTQRQIAVRAQEEALVQAERGILASDEAQKYRLLAEEYKKKLDACKDNQ